MNNKEILLDLIKRSLGDRLAKLEKKNAEEEASLKLIKTSFDGFNKKVETLIKQREQKIAKDKLEAEKKLAAKHAEEARKAKQKQAAQRGGRKNNLNTSTHRKTNDKIGDKKHTFTKTKSTANLTKKPLSKSRGKSLNRLNTTNEGGLSSRNTTMGTNTSRRKTLTKKEDTTKGPKRNTLGAVKKGMRPSKSMGKLLNKPTLKKASNPDDKKNDEIEEMKKMLNNIRIQEPKPEAEKKEVEEVKVSEEKKEEEKKDEIKIEQPLQTKPTLMSCHQEGILEKSIIQFLTEKEQITLFLCNKKLSSLALDVLKKKLSGFNNAFDLYIGQTIDNRISTLEAKYSKEELEAPLKNFELSRGCSKALGLLDEELYLRVFTNPVPEKTLDEIVIVYKLFCQLLNMEDYVQIKDNKIFWEKMSKFILDNKGNKLSDFCVRCVLKFNFDNKNIFKLKELAKDKAENLKPAYYSKICGTTGLFVFLIKDTLEYCGAIEDKKTPPSRIKSNYLYAKTIFDGINKFINFLEGFGPKKEEPKIEEKKPEENNVTEIKTETTEAVTSPTETVNTISSV